MLTYAEENFREVLPAISEVVSFTEDITGKQVTVWCIDKENTNPYRLFEKMGSPQCPDKEQLAILRNEGALKPVVSYVADGSTLQPLQLTANCVYFVTVE